MANKKQISARLQLKRGVIFAALLFFSTGTLKSQSNGFEVIRSMELLSQIYEQLEKYYVDDIEAGKLSKTAIDAMLNELDPYTVYYHESDIEDYQLMTTGQYGGIGALIRKIDEHVYIAEPYEENPAQKAGLRAGDKIIEIDGRAMTGKTSEDVSTALKGPKGTTVSILIERPNGKQETIAFTRDEIKIKDVPYHGMIDNEIGYIKLTSFTQTAHSEVLKAYNDLAAKGMKKLVFDLRGNGGGLLIEAVKLVNMFVPKDQIVVTTKGRVVEENRTYKTMGAPVDLDIPVAIMIDGGSASASEIVAGTLQDLDRGVVIGSTSFGKGLVQRTVDLDYGSKIKLTIAKYYTPSGRCVQRLEYYDKDGNAKPVEIPDSLLTRFTTKNGREVIDGRGIEPDVEVDQKEYSRLTATLFVKNMFFNFATDFYYRNPSISDAQTFRLSDEEYKKFKDFVLKENFEYSTASEEALKAFKETSEEEGYFEDSEKVYKELMEKVVPSKERDLDKFSREIKSILENEIVSRYYFQQGRVQHTFNDDDDLKEAISVLKDTNRYNTILGR
jgi:carboxyl-terminal processing protease